MRRKTTIIVALLAAFVAKLALAASPIQIPIISGAGWILPGAGLDLDFEHGRYFQQGVSGGLDSLLSVSRASPKYCNDRAGNYTQVGNNVLCVTDKGALIEEARTNGVRNDSTQGVVAGTIGSGGALSTNWTSTPAGMSYTVSGPFTENGIDYIRINVAGTATGNSFISFEATNQIVATYGQTWTNSHFFRQVSGTFPTVGTEIRYLTSGAVFISESNTAFTPAAADTPLGQARVSATFTPTNSTVGFVRPGILFGTVNLSVYNFTFDIGWPQAENNNNINSTVASATIAAGGTTGTAGTAVYQVGGGTGTPATLNVTVSGGAITAINSVASAGNYTVFPPSPAALTYVSGTGSGVVGATVNLVPTDNSAQGFATSPIRTTGASATRTADVVTATSPPVFGSAYTLFAKGTPNAPTGYTANQVIAEIDDGTTTNRVALFRLLGTGVATSVISTGSGPAGQGVWSQNSSGKFAIAYSSGDQAMTFNAAAVTTSAVAGLPTGLNSLSIGQRTGGNTPFNGYIERIALWPSQRLPNATLQSLTTP